jgi:quercetin dioxygenase-like cupin family protein
MGEPIVIPHGGGEVVGDSPDRRVEILSDHDALHATASRFGPGREGADLHVHRRHTDIFYVLEGELTVRLGVEDQAVAVPAGTFACLPPLVVHGFRNGSDAQLRYLNFHAPGVGFADYLRAIRDGRTFSYDQEPPPVDGVRPATDAVVGGHVDVEEIAIAELRGDPGGPSAPIAHAGQTQWLYVLEGELALTAGDRELRAPAGAWVEVPPGVRRALSSRAPARYLDVRAPRSG